MDRVRQCVTKYPRHGLLLGSLLLAGGQGCSSLTSGTAQDLNATAAANPSPNGGSTGSLIPGGSTPEQTAAITLPFAAQPLTQANAEDELQRANETEPQTIFVNPFKETASDPFSTFAADVDTASYDLFRSQLQNARSLPPPETVRTEEFVNYFEYDYPAPQSEDEHPFTIHLAATPDSFDTPRTMLRVGIQAQQPIAFEKKRTNLAFLVDTSGSMQDPLKLPLVKVLLSETLNVLDPEDRVSVVTYGGNTGLALPSTLAAEASTISAVIDDLGASGGTNGAQGIELAYDEVRSNFVENGINHVILCTDGDFNVGASSIEELVQLIEEQRSTGITFTAVGFGLRPNDAMMEAITNAGNGVYGVVGSEQQAKDYADERLLSTLQLVAKDLKIQVEFNQDQVYAYRLLGYENRAIADEDFRNDVVDAGEVGAGHRVTAIYELALTDEQMPKGVEATPGEQSSDDGVVEVSGDDLVLVKVRYKDVDATEQDPAQEVQATLGVGDSSKPDLDLKWAAAVAAFAELLRGSPLVDPSILDQLQNAVEEQAQRDAERTEFYELFLLARPMIEARIPK
jgi:Ca-activated chloride channel homolog